MRIREITPRQADFFLQCQFGSEPAKYLLLVKEPASGLNLRIPVCEACSRLSKTEILERV